MSDDGLRQDCDGKQPIEEPPASGRNADGTFAPGNLAALKHGGRSALVAAGMLPEQTEARAALSERVTSIVDDMGGADAVGVLARDMAERYAALQLVEGYLVENITRLGVLTPKGRQRAALNALLQVSDRLTRIALAIGLERRARDVNDSIEAAIAAELKAVR